MKKGIVFSVVLFSVLFFAFTYGHQESWPEIKGWPKTSRIAAMEMWQKYGKPNEITPTMLVWNNNGVWKRTIVYNREVAHNFPVEHNDVLEQTINYNVPPEKIAALSEYHGSLIVKRTEGELSAKCDKESANFLAINMAHEIVIGKRSAADARTFHANTLKNFALNDKLSEYMDGFKFDVPSGATNEKDKIGVTEQEQEQIIRKLDRLNEEVLNKSTGMR